VAAATEDSAAASAGNQTPTLVRASGPSSDDRGLDRNHHLPHALGVPVARPQPCAALNDGHARQCLGQCMIKHPLMLAQLGCHSYASQTRAKTEGGFGVGGWPSLGGGGRGDATVQLSRGIANRSTPFSMIEVDVTEHAVFRLIYRAYFRVTMNSMFGASAWSPRARYAGLWSAHRSVNGGVTYARSLDAVCAMTRSVCARFVTHGHIGSFQVSTRLDLQRCARISFSSCANSGQRRGRSAPPLLACHRSSAISRRGGAATRAPEPKPGNFYPSPGHSTDSLNYFDVLQAHTQ